MHQISLTLLEVTLHTHTHTHTHTYIYVYSLNLFFLSRNVLSFPHAGCIDAVVHVGERREVPQCHCLITSQDVVYVTVPVSKGKNSFEDPTIQVKAIVLSEDLREATGLDRVHGYGDSLSVCLSVSLSFCFCLSHTYVEFILSFSHPPHPLSVITSLSAISSSPPLQRQLREGSWLHHPCPSR